MADGDDVLEVFKDLGAFHSTSLRAGAGGVFSECLLQLGEATQFGFSLRAEVPQVCRKLLAIERIRCAFVVWGHVAISLSACACGSLMRSPLDSRNVRKAPSCYHAVPKPLSRATTLEMSSVRRRRATQGRAASAERDVAPPEIAGRRLPSRQSRTAPLRCAS